MHSSAGDTGRRRFLVRVITSIHAAIAATLGVILGGTVLSPLFGKQEENWLPAGTLANLPERDPLPVTLRVAREDGYNQVIERRSIFLVRSGESGVIAIDSTCTHLGCIVFWAEQKKVIACPCHAAFFTTNGDVISGPAPAPLPVYRVQVEGDQIYVEGGQA